MNKEITISMKLEPDDSKFNASVKKWQRELSEANKAFYGDAFGQGGKSSKAMEYFSKSMDEEVRKHHSNMRKYAQERIKVAKDIAREEMVLNQLLKMREELSKNQVKDLEKELYLIKEIKNSQEKIEEIKQRGAGGSGGGGGRSSMQNFLEGGMSAKGIGAVVATISMALSGAANLINQYASLPLTTASSLGSSTQSVLGNQMQELYSNPISAMAWSAERQKAMRYAQHKFGIEEATDLMKASSIFGGGTSFLKQIMGLGSGKVADLFLSNLTGLLGFGAQLPGQEIGVLGKALKGTSLGIPLSAASSGLGTLSKKLNHMSDKYFAAHQAQLMENFGKNFEQFMHAEKQMNPAKKLGIDYWSQNYMNNLNTQRLMGLSDSGLMGPHGFFRNTTNAGFTSDMGAQMANAIGAAGGSTRAMRGSSVLALQAQRGFDLTNAAQVMGAISGGAGSASASNRIFKSILASGVEEGLDASELRRYTQQTAEIIARTGTTNQNDIDRLLRGFNRFSVQGTPTVRQQAGTLTAYQQYQQQTSTASGRAGALQYSALAQTGVGKQMSPLELANVMQMPSTDITEDNPFIGMLASKYNKSTKQVVDEILEAKGRGREATYRVNPQWAKTLQKAGITQEFTPIKKGGKTISIKQQLDSLRKTNPAAYAAYTSLEGQLATQGYSDVQTREAQFRGFATEGASTVAGAGGKTPAQAHAEVQDRLTKISRDADKTVASFAVSSQAMIDNFNKMEKSIVPLASATSEYAKRLDMVAQAYNNIKSAEDKAAFLKWAGPYMVGTQTQAGKVKPGGG